MNLRKQVEPLKKAALQASSLQRHAHHAASRLTWMKRWLKRAYRHHAQSRELKLWRDLNVSFARLARRARRRVLTVRHYFRISADPPFGLARVPPGAWNLVRLRGPVIRWPGPHRDNRSEPSGSLAAKICQAISTRSSRRSSSPARSASSPVRARVVSRHRNNSSATFSAASTATRSKSPLGVESATAR